MESLHLLQSKLGGACALVLGYLLLVICVLINPPVCRGQEVLVEFSIAEESLNGTSVGNIITTARLDEKYTFDQDVLSRLEFQFIDASSLINEYFQIKHGSSNVTVKKEIDREVVCAFRESCEIEVKIGVVEPKEYLEIILSVIHVIDINDHAPLFSDDSDSLYIPESAQVTSSYPLPAAEDLDSGEFGIQTYELLSNYGNTFDLRVSDNDDGTKDVSLVLLKELDREQNSYYTLELVAKDGESNIGMVNIGVTVLDSNDNKPEFEHDEYEVYIYENIDLETSVLQVKASDKDEGEHGEIHYELSKQSASLYGSIFQVNRQTGDITTVSDIDYEKNKEFSLRIVAKDSGPSPMAGSAQVMIRVRDLNDNPPQITVNALSDSGKVEVAEHQPSNEFVALVSVSDPDGGSNGEVMCSIDSGYFRLIQLYPSQFKVVSSIEFDREERDTYTVLVTCADKGGLDVQITEKAINVTVVDINDHSPEFREDMYQIQQQENSGAGRSPILLQVSAEDRDVGLNGEVEYSLEAIGLYGNNVLEIDPLTGSLFVKSPLDYEVQTEYTFYVVATDRGTPPRSATASLVLTVIDDNDEVPTFSQPKYVFTVKENIPLGTSVASVMAYDLDSPPFNVISYSLVAIGSENKFEVDVHSGEIRTIGEIDKELMGMKQNYQVRVTASNVGYGLKSTVEVNIFVDDVNDNEPVISFPSQHNNSVRVLSSAVAGDFITQVRAWDPDMGQNAHLRYSIIPDGNDLVHISQDSGMVYVSKSLGDYGDSEIKLLIEASDSGDFPLSSKSQLNIYINATAVVVTEPESGNNLTFVVAVVVASVVLVTAAIVIFVIFLVRRRKMEKLKNKVVYSCQVEAQNRGNNNRGGGDGTYKGDQVKTVCDGVEQPKLKDWPDVVDVKQICYQEKSEKLLSKGCDQRRSSFQKDKRDSSQAGHRRVHFQEGVDGVSSEKPSLRGPGLAAVIPTTSSPLGLPPSYLGPPQLSNGSSSSGKSSRTSPVFREESRHKLLYGGGPRLTAKNLQVFNRDEDISSDQGSSIDSGRGPSEEEPDRSMHNHSGLSTTSQIVTPPTKDSPHKAIQDYICMNKVAAAKQPLPSNSKTIPRRSSSDTAATNQSVPTLPPRKPRNPHLVPPPSYHSNHRLASASSPEIMLEHQRQIVVPKSQQTPHYSQSPAVASGSYNDISGKNIGRYNCKQSTGVPTSQQVNTNNNIGSGGHYPYNSPTDRRSEHWSGFDYNCDAGDSHSEGGSSTSGSYMVDGVDLDREISNDVFV